jgi:hypothetical protein
MPQVKVCGEIDCPNKNSLLVCGCADRLMVLGPFGPKPYWKRGAVLRADAPIPPASQDLRQGVMPHSHRVSGPVLA